MNEELSTAKFAKMVSDQLSIGINIPEVQIHNLSMDTGKATLLTTQLVFATTLGTASFLLFCFLRTRWSTMFAPRSRLVGLAPEPLPRSFFGWIVPLLKMSESEVLDRVGLDAAVILSFFGMSYKLFAFCSLFGLVVLSPIKFTGYIYGNHSKNPQGDTPVGIPEHDTSEPLESYGILLSYVIFTWVFSLATFFFTFYNYREFSIMRHNYYRKWKHTISARTVMVTVLPKSLQTELKLAEFYGSLGLGSVQSVVVYKNVRKLRHTLEKRTYYLRMLERAYQEYLGNPCDYPGYDPDEALKEFEQNRKILVLSNIPKRRPTIRTGCLGLFGKKVDKIEYYTDKFNHYDKLVEQGRRGKYMPTSVGFVTFENVISAQQAAQLLIYDEPFQCKTTIAPEPWNVYDTGITLSFAKEKRLFKVFPWLAYLAKKNKILKWIIQSTFAPLALTVLNNLLPPKLMLYFSSLQGFHTRSTVELSTFAKYSAPLFINLVVLQGIGLFPVHLLQLSEISFALFMRIFYARTPREYAEASAPPFLDYGQELPPVILIFVIVLVYSSITPIILPLGAIYFFLGYLTYKYLLLHVYFHPYETSGLVWPKIFHRIIIGLYIYQLMMIGYLSLRNRYDMAFSLFPLLVVTTLYWYYVNEAYARMVAFIPLKTLREEGRIVDDDSSFAPSTSNSPNPSNNESSQITSPNVDKGKINSLSDMEIYRAAPDLYTDYSQPPMTLYDGVLNTGMRNYDAPALVGILPWLWLPVKRDKPNE
ncbi:16389_t:CDS:10 [Cetraspora pellucida]|uniref:16389_t:CDS:1 n=1 Tax=Cetraspora pellucida TaxID=1433469 RepID=A0A9N9EF90_9GLOM|nr:16389_t:CDS:10 [Cetraspora pellucida]